MILRRPLHRPWPWGNVQFNIFPLDDFSDDSNGVILFFNKECIDESNSRTRAGPF